MVAEALWLAQGVIGGLSFLPPLGSHRSSIPPPRLPQWPQGALQEYTENT